MVYGPLCEQIHDCRRGSAVNTTQSLVAHDLVKVDIGPSISTDPWKVAYDVRLWVRRRGDQSACSSGVLCVREDRQRNKSPNKQCMSEHYKDRKIEDCARLAKVCRLPSVLMRRWGWQVVESGIQAQSESSITRGMPTPRDVIKANEAPKRSIITQMAYQFSVLEAPSRPSHPVRTSLSPGMNRTSSWQNSTRSSFGCDPDFLIIVMSTLALPLPCIFLQRYCCLVGV